MEAISGVVEVVEADSAVMVAAAMVVASAVVATAAAVMVAAETCPIPTRAAAECEAVVATAVAAADQ